MVKTFRYWIDRLPFQPRILVGIASLGALIWVFAELAEDVLEQENHALDKAIMTGLRAVDDPGAPIGPAWLEGAFKDITSLGGPTVITIVTMLAVTYLLVAGRPWLAMLMGAAISIGALVEQFLKAVFDRPRPDVVPHLVEVHSLSFPSGHAMLSAMTYLTLGVLLAEAQKTVRLRAFVFAVSGVMTLLIGMSRVYLGVHWPSDVVAGWAAGAAWALIFWYLAARLSRSGRDRNGIT